MEADKTYDQAESTAETPIIESITDEQRIMRSADQEMLDAMAEQQRTIEYLLAHYGDQQFHYGPYDGTVSDIIALCPPIKSMLGAGPEAIIGWLDQYKVDQQEDDVLGEDEDTTEDEVGEERGKTHDETQRKEGDDVKKATRKESLEKEVKGVREKVTEKREKGTLKERPVKEKKRTKEPVKRQAKSEVKFDTKKETRAQSTSSKKEATKKRVATKSREKESFAARKMPEKGGSAPYPKLKHQSEPIQSTKAVALEAREIASKVHIKDEGEPLFIHRKSHRMVNEVTIQRDIDQELPAVNLEAMVQKETETETGYSAREMIDVIQSWTELARREAPLAVAVTQMVQDLMMTETLDGIEMIQSYDNISSEIFETASPELYALYAAVVSVRETVDRLYAAKTQQECRECIDQLTIELTVILTNLGYENPERIIREYMMSHPIDSLKLLIRQLEQALRYRIYQEARKVSLQTQQVSLPRHERLGKITAYIMALLGNVSNDTNFGTEAI